MERKKETKLDKELAHNWTMLCSGTSVDEQSKNISVFNIIETLNMELAPGDAQKKEKQEKGWYSVPLNLELVTKLQKLDIDLDLAFELKYYIIDPEGKKVGKEFGSTLKFGKGTDNLRIRNRIGTFPITTGGMYKIVVTVGEVGAGTLKSVGETNFKVNLNLKEEK